MTEFTTTPATSTPAVTPPATYVAKSSGKTYRAVRDEGHVGIGEYTNRDLRHGAILTDLPEDVAEALLASGAIVEHDPDDIVGPSPLEAERDLAQAELAVQVTERELAEIRVETATRVSGAEADTLSRIADAENRVSEAKADLDESKSTSSQSSTVQVDKPSGPGGDVFTSSETFGSGR